MRKLIRNAIRCNHCGDVIESVHRHQFVQCSCARVAVDGGLEYLKRSFTESINDYIELAEYEECDPDSAASVQRQKDRL